MLRIKDIATNIPFRTGQDYLKRFLPKRKDSFALLFFIQSACLAAFLFSMMSGDRVAWSITIVGVLTITTGIFILFRFKISAAKRSQKLLREKLKDQMMQLTALHQEESTARLELENAREEADHAYAELERKNRELEQFVYIASHDLREPLRTTSSFVDLFQKQYKGQLDEKADKYLSYISQASERMRTLINDLLDYSRIGNKKELQQIDCNALLNEVLTDLGTAINETGAIITTAELPVINGYPTSLKQLLQNLIANGIKFRQKNVFPQITISASPVKDAWHFIIADNGIGIEKKHSERIFIIFQRLHTRSEYEGSGIGLAHCKKIVEFHGGRIWVESIPGKGSSFHFTIAEDIE